jgi:hypothetical protein
MLGLCDGGVVHLSHGHGGLNRARC